MPAVPVSAVQAQPLFSPLLFLLFLFPAALFVFQAASAWTRIIRVNFLFCADFRRMGCRVVLVCSCYFYNLFSFHFLFHLDMEEHTDRIRLNSLCHLTEHVVSKHLVFHERIFLPHMPEDRFPDEAGPYRRYDPSICHQSL